jgi:hypothetical protein
MMTFKSFLRLFYTLSAGDLLTNGDVLEKSIEVKFGTSKVVIFEQSTFQDAFTEVGSKKKFSVKKLIFQFWGGQFC